MRALRIAVFQAGKRRAAGVPIRELTVQFETGRRPTQANVARTLAEHCPEFRRRKGRNAAHAGVEILPVLEELADGWRAWRLSTGANRPSGFEPPRKGRVGASNARNNPFADRDHGKWEFAELTLVSS
jgi:hypothetical protein